MNNLETVERFGRVTARTFMNPFFQIWGRVNAQSYDISNTILVASSGRGGSTWLAEIVGTLPGYPILYEPLNPKRNPQCRKNYSSKVFGTETSNSSNLEYLHRVFVGSNLSSRLVLLSHFKPEQYINFRGFVVKFIGINLQLYATLQQFPLRAILMIRHPCAVVASQLNSPHWSWVDAIDWKSWGLVYDQSKMLGLLLDYPNLLVDYPHLLEVQKSIRTKEEGLAFIWAVQNYVPLSQPKPHPWYLTTYERLITDGRKEVDRLFEYLEKPLTEKAYKHLKIPSYSTESKSNIATGVDPLSGWKGKLTLAQANRILSIAEQVGIGFYSNDLEPDYNQLSIACKKCNK